MQIGPLPAVFHPPTVGERQTPSGCPTRVCMQAQKLCPSDPLVANELGVLAYRNHQYETAAAWLNNALELVPGTLTASELSFARGA